MKQKSGKRENGKTGNTQVIDVPSKVVKEIPASAPPPKRGQKLVRYGSASGTPGQIVSFVNKWRENYNAFRLLGIRRAVELLEMGQRGDWALLQWTYRKLERCYPTLTALISRCEAPLLNYKWNIKVKSPLPDGFSDEDAARQQKTLHEAYAAVDNLREAIRHLHMAEFRGYAHLQKHRSGDGEVMHLECLDQWIVCRDGIYGDWFWNPDSKFTTAPVATLGEVNRIGGETLPLEDFIIADVPRPINEVALVTFVRWNLCQKDWDAFIEIYGVPGGVVEMPQNVPPDKEAEYEHSAKQVAEGGSGAIPNGSKYFPNDHPRGTDPFTPRIQQLDEDLVMAGTGGKMGMLNASAGLGGGNQSQTHDEVFQEIAASRAVSISETFQRGFDLEVLEREHPGEPALVYFELAPQEDVDVDALVKNIASLSGAGFKADVAWLNEQTGYQLEDAPEPQEQPLVDDSQEETIENRLRKLAETGDAEFEAEFALFNRDFPQVGRILNIGNPYHGFHGYFASADAGASGASDDGQAPNRITIDLADKALEKGFPVKDREGRVIHFGKDLKKHLDDDHTALDANGRKIKLKWAIETVRSGQRVELPDPKTGEMLAHYGKWFQDKGRKKGFLSIVSIRRGEAFTIIPAKKRHFRKRGLENRDEVVEQPTLVILKAIAAAGGPKDYFKHNRHIWEVKP